MDPRESLPSNGLEASECTHAPLAALPVAVDVRTGREIRFGMCWARLAHRKDGLSRLSRGAPNERNPATGICRDGGIEALACVSMGDPASNRSRFFSHCSC